MSREEVLHVLARWQERGWLRPLDRMLSRFLLDLDNEADGLLLLAAALVSHQLGRGHICLSLSELVVEPDMSLALPPEDQAKQDFDDLPSRRLTGVSLANWLDALGQSKLVGNGPGNSPLVLVGDRLYLRRYWQYEIDVATGIMSRVQQSCVLPDDLLARLDSLFVKPVELSAPDWQKIACALALRKAFSIITGGPGTGKTTTVVRLLALLQSSARQQGRALHIRLAAPTGKAAARLSEAIGKSLAQLPAEMQNGVPVDVCTLHKLLGARSGTRHLRHNADNPLHADLVVIDEASMIDLEMMAALLKALRPDTRLVLLGDKDQLASVEAGSVLGDLCRDAELPGYRADTVAWLQQLGGQSLDAYRGEQGLLNQQIAMLRVSHRFDENSGIAQLAWAVNSGLPERVRLVWERQPEFTDIQRIAVGQPGDDRLNKLFVDGWQSEDQSLAAVAVGYRHYLQVIKAQRPAFEAGAEYYQEWAEKVLLAFDQFQLLCALRKGVWGVETLNRGIAELLYQQGLIAQTHGWYEGRPVLVTRNDYGLGLMNGDIGIALNLPDAADGKTRLRVAFRQSGQQIRWVLPSRLNDAESVYAMTVHKSQGSEFNHVALLLPDQHSPVLSRELVYTGITRARQWFSLLMPDEAVLHQAVVRRVKRSGGLSDLLY